MKKSVSAIASSILNRSWKDIKFQINKLLDYAATHPYAKIRYHASQIQSWINSDASHINEPKARSLNGGFFYLLEKPNLPINPNNTPTKPNAPVLINRKFIDNFMYSVQGSENGSGFINGKYTPPLHNALHEMGHIQAPTPIQFDSIVANDIITDTFVQLITKYTDMLFY